MCLCVVCPVDLCPVGLCPVDLCALCGDSAAWMGLSSPDLLGHYSWVEGKSVTWNNWVSVSSQMAVQWPCVSVVASGQWEGTDCDQTLPFICEYSLNGE